MLDKALDLIRRIRRSLPETWSLSGWDTFDGHSYPILGTYFSEKTAIRAARVELKKLQKHQPADISGGQDGIQDQVYIEGPDGSSFRYLPEEKIRRGLPGSVVVEQLVVLFYFGPMDLILKLTKPVLTIIRLPFKLIFRR